MGEGPFGGKVLLPGAGPARERRWRARVSGGRFLLWYQETVRRVGL